MKRRNLLRYSALGLVGMILSCGRSPSTAPTALPPLSLAITDVSGLAALEQDYEAFRLALAAALGTEVEFFPVENYIAATVDLQQGAIDLALAGPSEYVVIRARTNAMPVLAITRPNYKSVIAVPADSDIATVADLQGKTIALSTIGSTSGHIGPTFLLIEAGLDPKTDVAVKMLGTEGSVAALKAGTVDAWGGSVAYFTEALQAEAKAFRILVEGNPLPDDVIIASSRLDPALLPLIQERLIANSETIVRALATHQTKFAGSTLKPAADADYDTIRAVYQAIGQGEFVQ